jgi:hypothetical protein
MEYTLIFGTPVYSSEKHIGKLARIIVDNGIANQITVDPGLLGIERVVPINALEEATADAIRMNVSDVEWKAFAAYQMQQSLTSTAGDTPNLSALTTDQVASGGITDSSHPTNDTGARRTVRTVGDTSIVLSSRTCVVNEDANGEQFQLQGLTVDTGRPQQLLLDSGSSLPFETVTLLDEDRIHVGGDQPAPLLEADQESITPVLERPLADRESPGQSFSRGE